MLSYIGYLAAGSNGHSALLSSTPRYDGSYLLMLPCAPRRRVGFLRRTIGWSGSDTTIESAASLHDSQTSGDLTGEKQHSEQRSDFRPPLPFEDDGHIVDLSLLQNLLDSDRGKREPLRRKPSLLRRDAGALQVARRPVNYRDRRTDGYTEPLEIYVLGTSHASEASARDVRRVIRAVRPQSVVVEATRKSHARVLTGRPCVASASQLCKSRAGLMMPAAESNVAVGPLTMSGENFAATVIRSLRLGGQSTALLRAALAWAAQGSMDEDGQAAKPTEAMYGEFRAARESAEEEEAQIVLGDRPIEITLQRTWKALSFSERLDLVLSFTRLAFERAGIRFGGSGAEVDDTGAAEKLLRQRARLGEVDEDTLEVLIATLAERFPSVVGPLIDERDLYLAWTLKRSRAVCGQRRVVGVVGRGHLSGVMRAISTDKGGDALVFKELAGPQGGGGGAKRRGRGRNLASFAARLAVETAAGYAIWELYKSVTA